MSNNITNKIKLNINIDDMNTVKTDLKNNKIMFFKNETINLILNILDNNNEPFDFEGNYSFILYGKMSDNTYKYQSELIEVKDNIISIKLKPYMTNIVGVVQYQLKIMDSEENENYLPIIVGSIADTLLSDTSSSEDSIVTIDELNTQILLLKSKLEDITTQVTTIKETTDKDLLTL